MIGLILKAAIIICVGVGGGWHDAWAVRYAPGVFGRVARNRGMSIVPCMAAHPTLEIGTWIEVEGPAGMERARVTDTSAPKDRDRHIRMRRLELSYDCALRVCGASWQGAAVECPIRWRIRR